MKQCLECKKEFQPKSKLAKFCSNKCRQKRYREDVNKLLEEARGGKIVSAKVVKEQGQHKAEIKIELPQKERPLTPPEVIKDKPKDKNEPLNWREQMRKKKLGW
jgi:hypothetical protein